MLGALVLVALAVKADANAPGDVADALVPQVLVQLGADAHIGLQREKKYGTLMSGWDSEYSLFRTPAGAP